MKVISVHKHQVLKKNSVNQKHKQTKLKNWLAEMHVHKMVAILKDVSPHTTFIGCHTYLRLGLLTHHAGSKQRTGFVARMILHGRLAVRCAWLAISWSRCWLLWPVPARQHSNSIIIIMISPIFQASLRSLESLPSTVHKAVLISNVCTWPC